MQYNQPERAFGRIGGHEEVNPFSEFIGGQCQRGLRWCYVKGPYQPPVSIQ